MEVVSYLLGKKAGGGGGSNFQSKSVEITENGTTNIRPDTGYDALSSVTVNTNVSSGEVEEKDVNFYDYDGTLLYSYTKQEFLALESLPANPSHEGLTAQGWNWTLSEIKSDVETHGFFNVGQLYTTDDGKTRIYVDLNFEKTNMLNVSFGFCPNGTVNIDWGDGTNQNVSGSSTSTCVFTQHQYAKGGDYVIKLTPVGTAKFQFLGGNNFSNDTIEGSYILGYSTSTSRTLADSVYRGRIKKIELGSGITSTGNYAFRGLTCLEAITIPQELAYINQRAFDYCMTLKSITTIGSIVLQAFENCGALTKILQKPQLSYSAQNPMKNSNKNFEKGYVYGYAIGGLNLDVKEIYVSNTTTLIGNSAFGSYSNVEKIIFGKNLQTMQGDIFGSSNSNLVLSVLDFRNALQIPTGTTSASPTLNSNCKIIVPDSLYSSWITHTNWSSLASQIVKASEA